MQMLVEKIDLKSLFGPICAGFFIPIGNARGWSDMNCRGAMMRRFAEWEAKGKVPVLLHCGDFDPVGLAISDFLRSNMAELAAAVGWSPDHPDHRPLRPELRLHPGTRTGRGSTASRPGPARISATRACVQQPSVGPGVHCQIRPPQG